MAVLSSVLRAKILKWFMRENDSTCSFSKPELLAAIAATDQWVEDNTTSFVTALNTSANGFRTKSTATQKTLVLTYVLLERAGLLHLSDDPDGTGGK